MRPSNRPSHHPDEDLLVAYASGGLGEAESLVVATHLALCPDCRADVGRLETIGGAMLEDIAPVTLSAASRDAVMARLDDAAAPVSPAMRRSVAVDGLPGLPQPLAAYVGEAGLRWRGVVSGIAECELLSSSSGHRAVLLRIDPRMVVPKHTHEGRELTLVLAGGFSDQLGHFLPGDVEFGDRSLTHRPAADPGEPCICLAATTGPLRLAGWWTRFLNPFLR